MQEPTTSPTLALAHTYGIVFSTKELPTLRIIPVYKPILSSQLALAPQPCRNSVDLVDALLFSLEDLRDVLCDKPNRITGSSFPEGAPNPRHG